MVHQISRLQTRSPKPTKGDQAPLAVWVWDLLGCLSSGFGLLGRPAMNRPAMQRRSCLVTWAAKPFLGPRSDIIMGSEWFFVISRYSTYSPHGDSVAHTAFLMSQVKVRACSNVQYEEQASRLTLDLLWDRWCIDATVLLFPETLKTPKLKEYTLLPIRVPIIFGGIP